MTPFLKMRGSLRKMWQSHFVLHEVTTNRGDVDEHAILLMRNWHKIDMESYIIFGGHPYFAVRESKHLVLADNKGKHVKETLFLLLF